jgi:hypothetical protein
VFSISDCRFLIALCGRPDQKSEIKSLKSLRHPHCSSTLWPIPPFDLVHEGAHQENAPALMSSKVFRIRRIGNVCGIKSLALIPYFNFQFVIVAVENHLDGLALVLLVAMHHGVRHGLAHSHFNPNDNSSDTPQLRMKSVTAAAASATASMWLGKTSRVV